MRHSAHAVRTANVRIRPRRLPTRGPLGASAETRHCLAVASIFGKALLALHGHRHPCVLTVLSWVPGPGQLAGEALSLQTQRLLLIWVFCTSRQLLPPAAQLSSKYIWPAHELRTSRAELSALVVCKQAEWLRRRQSRKDKKLSMWNEQVPAKKQPTVRLGACHWCFALGGQLTEILVILTLCVAA